MKLSNFILSIVACLTLGAAVGSSSYVISKQPTSEIIVTDNQSNKVAVEIPKNLSAHQAQILGMAYDIAKNDGHKQPQLLQGIVLQESNAGDSKYKVAGQEAGLKPNSRYYGVGQIKLAAAQEVLNRYPKMKQEFEFHTNTDEEIIAKLIENDRFNLSIASKYLLVLKSYGYDTIRQVAVAYNKGAGGAKGVDPNTNQYSLGVMAHIQNLKLN
jgi:hypothetical protein